VHRLRIPAGLFSPRPVDELELLGHELRQEIGPERWLGAGPEERMGLVAAAHHRVCRCLRLPISQLVFEPQRPGPLIRHDPLTSRVFISSLLIADHDPIGIVRALFQASWQRARGRRAPNRVWLRSPAGQAFRPWFWGLWRVAIGRDGRREPAGPEPGAALARVVAGFAPERR
jgi:hypothetical protein